MAKSKFNTSQYTSEQFVESCGAILFDLSRSQKEVCLIHHLRTNEWYLAKGRRNQRESRHQTALREVAEETGFRAHLYPVSMLTRAPPADEAADAPDKAFMYPGLTEPFMFTMRAFDQYNVKMIWWYIAEVDEGAREHPLLGEVGFKPEFFPCEEAIEKLTFETDREVLRKALELVEGQSASLPN